MTARGRPVGLIYKHRKEVEPETTWNKSSGWSELYLNLELLDFKFSALNHSATQPRQGGLCLYIYNGTLARHFGILIEIALASIKPMSNYIYFWT